MPSKSASSYSFSPETTHKQFVFYSWFKGKNVLSVLGIVLVIGAIGTLAYMSIQKQKTAQQTPNEVSVQTTKKDTFEKIEAEYALFFTKAIIPEKRRTFVQIPYYLPDGKEHIEMWLTMETNLDSEPIIVLVDHPLFGEISYPRLDSPSASLYQKNPTYTSVMDFWENPPTTGKILADPVLVYKKKFENYGNVTSLSEDTNWQNYDYILTTYRVPIEKDGYKIFETTVDASEAALDDKQQIFWKLDIPGGGADNRVYIGEIHVDFRLPL